MEVPVTSYGTGKGGILNSKPVWLSLPISLDLSHKRNLRISSLCYPKRNGFAISALNVFYETKNLTESPDFLHFADNNIFKYKENSFENPLVF